MNLEASSFQTEPGPVHFTSQECLLVSWENSQLGCCVTGKRRKKNQRTVACPRRIRERAVLKGTCHMVATQGTVLTLREMCLVRVLVGEEEKLVPKLVPS